MNPSTEVKFRVRAKKIPGPILIDPGMSHFYPQDPGRHLSSAQVMPRDFCKTPLFAQSAGGGQVSAPAL
jgi:hypothetical protein